MRVGRMSRGGKVYYRQNRTSRISQALKAAFELDNLLPSVAASLSEAEAGWVEIGLANLECHAAVCSHAASSRRFLKLRPYQPVRGRTGTTFGEHLETCHMQASSSDRAQESCTALPQSSQEGCRLDPSET